MPQLFPPWSDLVLRIVLGTIVLVIGCAVIGPIVYARTPFQTGQDGEVDEPVPFDHRHHVRDDGIDCRYCHQSVERSSVAGIPATEVCTGCHSQIWQESPMLDPVRRSYFSGDPIPWNRANNVPDFVYFDHSIHLNKGVGCVTCHGRVDQMPLAHQARPLTMGWCLDCHRNPERHLRPRDQITSMTWAPSDAHQGERLAALYGVRHLTQCTACHR
jgi:hypothetical protein